MVKKRFSTLCSRAEMDVIKIWSEYVMKQEPLFSSTWNHARIYYCMYHIRKIKYRIWTYGIQLLVFFHFPTNSAFETIEGERN